MVGTSDWDIGLDVKVRGVDEVIREVQFFPPEVRAALVERITADAQRMRDEARALASGDVLQEKTGSYVESIQYKVISNDNGVFGFVFSDDPRVDLFEYGGSTPARDILPSVKEVMAFAGGGSIQGLLTSLGVVGDVFAKIVHRPVVQYPKHTVIHAAFDDMEDAVEHDIESAARSIIIDHGA
jgi:hypothetical protein